MIIAFTSHVLDYVPGSIIPYRPAKMIYTPEYAVRLTASLNGDPEDDWTYITVPDGEGNVVEIYDGEGEFVAYFSMYFDLDDVPEVV